MPHAFPGPVAQARGPGPALGASARGPGWGGALRVAVSSVWGQRWPGAESCAVSRCSFTRQVGCKRGSLGEGPSGGTGVL